MSNPEVLRPGWGIVFTHTIENESKELWEKLPKCRCGYVYQWYGVIAGFSVQCKTCNERQAEKRRAAYKGRK